MTGDNYKIKNIYYLIVFFSLLSYGLFLYIRHDFSFDYLPLSNKYAPPFIMLFVVTTIYSLTRKKFRIDEIYEFGKESTSHSNIRILDIFYVLLFTCSVLIVVMTNSRPLSYFIIIAIICGVLTLKILCLPEHNKYYYASLVQVGLIAINLRYFIQYIFPDSFIWYDPYYHQEIIEYIILNGHTLSQMAYSSIPIFHVLLASEYLMGGMNNFISLFAINSIVKAFLIVIIIYLMGWKFLNSKKIGLLSSLAYAVLDRTIIYDVSYSPTSLATILVMIIIYLILSRDISKRKLTFTILGLLFMSTLIFTHTVTSVMLLVLLIAMWLSSNISVMLKENDISMPSIMNIFFIFFVGLFVSWIYISGYYITQLANMIKWGFKVDELAPYMSAETTTSTMFQIPLIEHILSYLGFYFFAILSIVGFLYSFLKNKNKYLLFFSISSVLLFIVTFSGIVLKTYVIPDRWWYYSEHMTIIMVFGLICLSYYITLKNKKITILIIVLFFTLFSFISITNPIANLDSPIYSKNLTVRHVSTSSEVQSINAVSQMHGGKILTDVQSIHNINQTDNVKLITGPLFSNKEYTNFDGLIILRKYILDGNPFDARGLYKIDHDPRIYLEKEKFSKIYDSNTVYGYVKI